MTTTRRAIIALSLAFAGLAVYAAKGDEKVDTRVFELRTYTAAAGKMDALQARFRDHTCKLFEKHHMTVIGFWSPADAEQSCRRFATAQQHAREGSAAGEPGEKHGDDHGEGIDGILVDLREHSAPPDLQDEREQA